MYTQPLYRYTQEGGECTRSHCTGTFKREVNVHAAIAHPRARAVESLRGGEGAGGGRDGGEAAG